MEIISVIIPVYKTEKYLERCIDSVLTQTYGDYRIILVDDGSPDQSGAICDTYAGKYPDAISVYHQKNSGVSAARNLGISVARGKYLYFLDSDDWIEPGAFAYLLTAAESREAQITIGGVYSVLPDESKTEITRGSAVSDTLLDPDRNREVFFIYPGVFNKLINRDFFLSTKLLFHPIAIGEDLQLSIKLLSAADRVLFIDIPFYNYRYTPSSAMNAGFVAKYGDLLSAFDGIITYLRENNDYDKYHSEIEYLAVKNVLLDASVRLIKNTKDRQALLCIHNWTMKNFPDYKKNPYRKRFSIREKIILFFLGRKNYPIVSGLFRLKNI